MPRKRDPNKPKRNIWKDPSPYGTYEGDAGNPEQWAQAFGFVKMSREQALKFVDSVDQALEVLGLIKGATEALIRKAMAKLVVIHHPDKGGDADKFNRIMAAYTLLIDK